jgi:hypothetical protein
MMSWDVMRAGPVPLALVSVGRGPPTDARVTEDEMQWRWVQQQPIEGTTFMLNDSVRVVGGPHAGSTGSAVALLAVRPEPRYRVELCGGGDVQANESELRSANLREPMGSLSVLQHWYARQADGDWEHEYGIRLETLDNPGWHLSIDLADTELATRPFTEIRELDAGRDWIVCEVVDGRYEARGGPFMLERMLRVFSEWARLSTSPA